MTRRQADTPGTAVAMICCAVFCFSILDGMIKSMAPRLPIPFLVWARWTFQVIAMLIWLAPSMGRGIVRTQRLGMQLARGALLIASSLCFMSALKFLPLADATALNFLSPTLVMLLAVVFLDERLTRARVAFVVAGVAGMLMIVKPGADLFQGASLLALGSATCYAVFQILTRVLALEDPRVTLFYPALVGSVFLTFAWLFFGSLIDLTWMDLGMLAAMGVLGTAGHFLFILAFQRAPASAVTPFTFLQLVFATLIGWLAFNHFPDNLTLFGMAVIAASGLLLTWYERRQRVYVPPDPLAVD